MVDTEGGEARRVPEEGYSPALERIMSPSQDTPTPSEPSPDSAPQQRKPFYKCWWFFLIVILLALPVIKKIVDPAPPKPVASQSAQSATAPAPTVEPVPQSSAEPEPEPEPAVDADSTPEAEPTTHTARDEGRTTGGIGYGEAYVACDRAAQKRLFPGLDYNSDPILGEQKGQVGLSDDQYLAIYNVKAGGRKTAITCLVDGTKDNVHVISVRETERR